MTIGAEIAPIPPPAVAGPVRIRALGVRPEDIHIAGPSDPADLCMEAEVEVTEQLGSEIVLDTRVGKAAIVASVDPTSKVRVHDKLKLALNPARIHLFDAETEAAV